jgi:hypothetical protein
MTGHANLARGHDQERAALELVSVFIQHSREVVDLGWEAGAWESKKDDAGVGEALVDLHKGALTTPICR